MLWPRLASIQGLHLHQSDTKPHGPPKIVSPQEEVIVTDLCYLKRKMPQKHFTWYLVQVIFRHVDPFNAADRCRMNLHAASLHQPVTQTFHSECVFLGGESFTNRYDDTSSRPKDSIILEIRSELLFRNSPRLISAWH